MPSRGLTFHDFHVSVHFGALRSPEGAHRQLTATAEHELAALRVG